MRRLTRLLVGRRANGERGAIAVLTATLVMFVAIGLLALTVDLGNITYNRAQLQNGADASSLALAAACASGNSVGCAVTPGLTTLAEKNANASNGGDQSMSIDKKLTCIANFSGAPSLPTCPSAGAEDTSNLSNCQPLPAGLPAALPYVEVTTQTKMQGSGSSILPFHFAQILNGGKVQGSTSQTCARAAWGPVAPTSVNVLNLTMSECDWSSQTGYNVTLPPNSQPTFKLAPAPVYTASSPYGYDSIPGNSIPDWPSQHGVWSKGNATTCHTSSPGGTAPGGFAWLKPTTCQAKVSDGWTQGDTGANSNCSATDLNSLLGKVAYIPVFDCSFNSNPGSGYVVKPGDNCNAGSGSNAFYHIKGYAAFYVSGWFFNPPNQSTIVPGASDACGNNAPGGSASQRCIFGWFTAALVTDPNLSIQPPTTADPNYGLSVVKPAG